MLTQIIPHLTHLDYHQVYYISRAASGFWAYLGTSQLGETHLPSAMCLSLCWSWGWKGEPLLVCSGWRITHFLLLLLLFQGTKRSLWRRGEPEREAVGCVTASDYILLSAFLSACIRKPEQESFPVFGDVSKFLLHMLFCHPQLVSVM